MSPKSSLEVLIQRDRIWISVGLCAVIGLAWIYLMREAAVMGAMAADARAHAAMGMAGMNMRAWDVSDWFALFGMWTIMMAGMMLPSASPVVLLVLGAYRLRGDSQARLSATAFLAGYLLVWTAFSLFVSLGQVALHRAAVLSQDMRLQSAALSGALLIAVGIYQWIPLKNRCLSHCQAPLAFLTRYWRTGVSGGLQMGMRHGALCVGCCWMLMTLLFVVGVMNLVWVAALGAFVLLEKLAPGGAIAGRLAGAAAAGWGLYVLVSA
jgi:predicted metal-binding membrane protein